MDLKELTEKLERVVEDYNRKFNLNITGDQVFLKLHEELGEVTKAYLKFTGVARNKEGKSKTDLQSDLAEEIADLIGISLVFAKGLDIDIEKAIEDKWLKWLDEGEGNRRH